MIYRCASCVGVFIHAEYAEHPLEGWSIKPEWSPSVKEPEIGLCPACCFATINGMTQIDTHDSKPIIRNGRVK